MVRQDDIKDRLYRATAVHKHANHPCIVQFYEVFNTSGYVCYVMEYVPGGNLFQYVDEEVTRTGRGLPEDVACSLFCDCIDALRHLHSIVGLHPFCTLR